MSCLILGHICRRQVIARGEDHPLAVEPDRHQAVNGGMEAEQERHGGDDVGSGTDHEPGVMRTSVACFGGAQEGLWTTLGGSPEGYPQGETGGPVRSENWSS